MDENRTRLEQPQQDAPKKRSLWPLFFFPMALLYHELLLRAFDTTVSFFDTALLPIALSALGSGLLLSLLANLLPWRKATRWAGLAVILLWSV